MSQNLPATRPDEPPTVLDTVHDLHPADADPQHQQVQQNVGAGLIPLALIVLLILAFVAAAWTFLAARP
jgi:hypothetical protein